MRSYDRAKREGWLVYFGIEVDVWDAKLADVGVTEDVV